MLDFLLNRLRRSDRERYAETIGSQSDCASLYAGIIAASAAYVPVCSGREVRVHRNLDFGAAQREVMSSLGRPDHAVYALNPLTEAILVYRCRLEACRIREELHFSRHGLFYVNRTLSSMLPRQDELILRILSDKYLDGQPFDGIDTKIVDSRGREIVTTSGPPFVVEYLAALDPILSRLRADAVIDSSQPPGLDRNQRASAISSLL
ncbi:hypothetical protein [Thiocapsa rosea]|uniref:Uncharacterized protein n=1 Tax=Thiocapsa rosea TaxID=69360 RepID=A0A495V9Y6_9GAMM|nr:hypothetical protein [Thiocapsa rosea]RKT46129.1 hypothetical protein BDD21_3628 [Thiocapsa rosea]